jgi:DNA repair protein RecO (recombination protein O)
MRWADDGIFLNGRPYGETSVIADIFTRSNGRARGLVKGGRSRRIRPVLQTGNGLKVEWRARLDDQLGVYTMELTEATAARALDDRLALAGVNAVASLLQVLPERDPHPKLFSEAEACLQAAGSAVFSLKIIRFELRFLEELGFGLDLTKCVATGERDGLAYVSPKSGQAVTQAAGEPYSGKLLRLPGFLLNEVEAPSPAGCDIVDGLTMTGYFLRRYVFAETGGQMPRAREDFARFIEHGLSRRPP